ncbi:Caspase domain [uncultured Ruminococcus sp.]|nr:Caspase domain [uncultured Ruminococcus sp.]
MRKALCVGIDCYEHADDLHGCVNDANSVKAALERNGDGTLNFEVKLMCATSALYC